MSVLEIVSSIASTIMSTVVAIVALVFTYRQNVGWPPVALVTGSAMQGTGGRWEFKFRLTVEFWNRQKYPVAMRIAVAEISGLELLRVDPSGPDDRNHIFNNTAYVQLNESV